MTKTEAIKEAREEVSALKTKINGKRFFTWLKGNDWVESPSGSFETIELIRRQTMLDKAREKLGLKPDIDLEYFSGYSWVELVDKPFFS